MSRIRFNDDQEFIDWLRGRSKDKYEFYDTSRRIIAVPTVSTRPVLYGIYIGTEGDVRSAIRNLGYGPIYTVTEYQFDETAGESSS